MNLCVKIQFGLLGVDKCRLDRVLDRFFIRLRNNVILVLFCFVKGVEIWIVDIDIIVPFSSFPFDCLFCLEI